MTALAMLFLIAHLSTGVLNILIALPLIRRRIPPNGLYGFRTRKTRANEQVWYDANAYSGHCLKLAGIATIAAGFILYSFYFVVLRDPATQPPRIQMIYLGVGLCILTLPVLASVVASYRHLHRIAP
ncbi:MAG: hypothetical protein ABS79_07150 [Planctomycetes bacterium SCN 63-9]|nr:MAG: hypothetical protein ABS79_07150 [Planctomycetes bacterium SCN 63-9]